MKSVRSKVLLLLFAPLTISQSSAFVLTFRTNCCYSIDSKSVSTAVSAEPINISSEGSISSSTTMTVNRKQLLVSLGNNLSCDDDDNKPKLILASQSPRRREILTMMGLCENKHYTVEYSPLDESILQKELVESKLSSIDYTRRLAEAKAYALADLHANDNNNKDKAAATTFYLGSDTIVELDECILEKPKDTNDAKRMLNLLSGRQHHVHTGVALYRLNGNDNQNQNQNQISLIESFTETACVTFADLTEEDIDSYIISGEPMDKAGSYGIQGIGGQFVKTISGDFFTVMGLPMHKTSQLVASALQAE